MAALSNSPAFGPQITKPLSPKRMMTDAIKNQSTIEVSHVLQTDRSLLPYALSTAVFKALAPMTKYLLTSEGAAVHRLTPLFVAAQSSIELLDAVFTAAWDLNKWKPGTATA